MPSYMPELYPGELYYSWISRFHIHSCYSMEDTFRELFGVRKVFLNIYYPIHLNYLCNQLPSNWGYTPEYIIYNHTILPFFFPFMSTEDVQRIIDAIKIGNTSQIGKYLGIVSGSILFSQKLRVCPYCYYQDIKKYGEPYLHRNHQIDGCKVCLEHKEFLIEYNLPDNESEYNFFDISSLNKGFLKFGNKVSEEIFKLTENIYQIANGTLNGYSIDTIKKKYEDMLYNKECRTLGGVIKYDNLINLISNSFSEELLNILGIDNSINSIKEWLKKITSIRYKKVHPLKHMLLIISLCGDVINFIEHKNNLGELFGESPWPCLNKICNYYKESVIPEFTIVKNRISYSGYFKCPFCGFTYSRSIPAIQEGDRFKGKIIEMGHIWEKKLIELVSSGLSIQHICSEMKSCRKTVIMHSRRLGIVEKLNTKSMYKDKDFIKITQLENDKNILIEYLNKNPGATRTQIRSDLEYIYRRLAKKAGDWLERNLPPSQIGVTKNDLSHCYKDWEQRDSHYSTIILEAINEIIAEQPLRRVTLRCIYRKVGYSGILDDKCLSKMPLTKDIINKHLETFEDFKKRKIIILIKQHIANNQEVTEDIIRNVMKMKRKEYEKYMEFIKTVIVEYG